MPIEIPKDTWPGMVRNVTLGATPAEGGTRTRVVTVGGEKALSFHHFEAPMAHPPVLAVEIKDGRPEDWSPVLLKAWGEAVNDAAAWAKAAEATGADVIVLSLGLVSAAEAVKTVKKVLAATGLPLVVFGPGQAEVDNEQMVAIAEATKGERLVLGICEDKNYRTIVATAMANGHLVTARTPMDVNLAKQLNILISDMGFPMDRVLMDPTTGALGYGIEYGFSAMERLRLAALQGDSMTQLPMLITPGYETWKTKESKVGGTGSGVPESWGDWEKRGINWEVLTAITLLDSCADIVVLRHPESIRQVKAAITELVMAG